jgi:hypothetical protein
MSVRGLGNQVRGVDGGKMTSFAAVCRLSRLHNRKANLSAPPLHGLCTHHHYLCTHQYYYYHM